MYVQMFDIYQKYRKKSDYFDIFENITIFSNPARMSEIKNGKSDLYGKV